LSASYSRALIDDFATQTGTRAIQYIPRSLTVSQSELYGQTVIEAAPDSPHADLYRALAKTVAEDTDPVIPKPLSVNDLRQWARNWGDQILQEADGVVTPQGAI
jgi:nitrogenase iron protein NifH